LVLLFILSLLLGNYYIFSSATIVKGKEMPIVIQGNKENNGDGDFLTKNAFAYYDLPRGENIIEEDVQSQYPEAEFFLVVDNGFLAKNVAVQDYSSITASRKNIITYIVKEGDSPSKIAAQFGVSLNTILWANNLKSGSVIKPGQELLILPITGVYHTVQKGETLSAIAKKYSVSVGEIKEFNEIGDILAEGTQLIIPNGKMPATSSTKTSIASKSSASKSSSASTSLAAKNGLKPMTEDVSGWQKLDSSFLYPTNGGYNKGILHYYNAVDIINYCGSPIYAAADGLIVEVKSSGYNNGYGSYVKIQHFADFKNTITVYAHLGSVLVSEGQKVSQGALIGKMGDTGNANGCHLHFEVRNAQNPFVLKQ
jgi:LysM repeat protein